MDDHSRKPEVRKLSESRLEYFERNGNRSTLPIQRISSRLNNELNRSPSAILRNPSRFNNEILQKYRGLKIFQEPVQLICTSESNLLSWNDNAIHELRKIEHHVNVVAVVGKLRTGKSLLMNRLAKVNKAFGVGNTHNTMTKGIWIFCRPHPKHESQVLVLLDTEGLDDAMKEKKIEDRWLFLLAALFSSTLVYNHKGTLDAEAIKKLKFLKDFKTAVNVRESEGGDDSYLDVYLPAFVVVVRDNILEIVDNQGNAISPDQFLENVLVLKKGDTDTIRKFNEPRRLVRRYFKDRKCFMFSPPASPTQLNDGRNQKNKVFEMQVDAFLDYIYGCKPKQLTSGKVLNGRMLSCLIRSYTKFIQEGKPPCIHEAAKEMIENENQNTLQNAVEVYKKEMQRLIGSNMPESEIMAKFHEQCRKKAIDILRGNIVYDDKDLFLDTANEYFFEALAKFERAIAKDSEKVCRVMLMRLDTTRIGGKMKAGAYVHVSGYDEYIKDIEEIVKMYNQTTGLGPKKKMVLQDYLDGKEQEEEDVYKIVKKIQDETQKANTVEVIKRSVPRQHSIVDDSHTRPESSVSEYLLNLIIEEQNLQKEGLSRTFHTCMKKKIAEYERQKSEEAESAVITKEENDRFKKTFLDELARKLSRNRLPRQDCEKPITNRTQKKCRIL